MDFKTWAETDPQAMKQLRPDLGLREWEKISPAEKVLIWQHLQIYFFDSTEILSYSEAFHDDGGPGYEFEGSIEEQVAKKDRIRVVMEAMSVKYRANNYAKNYLAKRTSLSACQDFSFLWHQHSEAAVVEALSLYAKCIILENNLGVNLSAISPTSYLHQRENESDEAYRNRIELAQWGEFDEFALLLNEVFSDFGLNYTLTRLGFVPRQDNKIIENIYFPVLKVLSNPRFREVDRDLSESFTHFLKNTPQDYSTSITKAISAVQGFLQIIVYGKIGGAKFAATLKEAIRQGLIPNDRFSEKVFLEINSIMYIDRELVGDAHPKLEFATRHNALLILNLAMVFFQHCLTDKPNIT